MNSPDWNYDTARRAWRRRQPPEAFVYQSLAIPGKWMIGGREYEDLFGHDYDSSLEAMRAVVAEDRERDVHETMVENMRADAASPLDRPGFGELQADTNPKTRYGDKKPPLHLVPPAFTLAAAGVFKLGARKYGPYNWREKTVSSSVYQGAAMRHLLAWWDGEDIDPESGESHLAHAAACIGILLDAEAIGKLNDNRPVRGAAAEIIREKEDPDK